MTLQVVWLGAAIGLWLLAAGTWVGAPRITSEKAYRQMNRGGHLAMVGMVCGAIAYSGWKGGGIAIISVACTLGSFLVVNHAFPGTFGPHLLFYAAVVLLALGGILCSLPGLWLGLHGKGEILPSLSLLLTFLGLLQAMICYGRAISDYVQ